MDADDLYFEGLDRFAEEDWQGAIERFKAAAEVDPDYVDAYHGIARASFEGREADPALLDDAIVAAKRIIELTPGDVTAYSTLSQCYVWKGDKDTAEFWGNKARIAGWKDQLTDDKRRREGRVDPKTEERKLT